MLQNERNFIPISGRCHPRDRIYIRMVNYRLPTILSLTLATVLGVRIFSSTHTEPLVFHIIFLVLVMLGLSGLLHGIRSRIEMWLNAHESGRRAMQTLGSGSERTHARSVPPGAIQRRPDSRELS